MEQLILIRNVVKFVAGHADDVAFLGAGLGESLVDTHGTQDIHETVDGFAVTHVGDAEQAIDFAAAHREYLAFAMHFEIAVVIIKRAQIRHQAHNLLFRRKMIQHAEHGMQQFINAPVRHG